jgi:hypothetical protein
MNQGTSGIHKNEYNLRYLCDTPSDLHVRGHVDRRGDVFAYNCRQTSRLRSKYVGDEGILVFCDLVSSSA